MSPQIILEVDTESLQYLLDIGTACIYIDLCEIKIQKDQLAGVRVQMYPTFVLHAYPSGVWLVWAKFAYPVHRLKILGPYQDTGK
jgi:hypothetical protein